ncbi:hypothetical protein D3C81_1529360 [compost metagenome]
MPGLATGKGALGTADASGDTAFDNLVAEGHSIGRDVHGVCANARQQRGAEVVAEQPGHLAFGLADEFRRVANAARLHSFADGSGQVVSTLNAADTFQYVLRLLEIGDGAALGGQGATGFGASAHQVTEVGAQVCNLLYEVGAVDVAGLAAGNLLLVLHHRLEPVADTGGHGHDLFGVVCLADLACEDVSRFALESDQASKAFLLSDGQHTPALGFDVAFSRT